MVQNVIIAPPVRRKSVMFIATSIDIIDRRDIPIAVLKAEDKVICLLRTIVSSKIEVTSPLKIARHIIANTGHSIALTWKNNIVPKSPIEQPARHHKVL